MTTIILADDHQILRQGIKALLETDPEFRVVGQTGDGLEVVQLTERLRPNVLVLDLGIPRLHGLEALRQVRQYAPATKVVVLSMHADDPYVREALRNGASAYVLKDASGDDLVQAIRQVLEGRRYLSPALSELAIDCFLKPLDAPDEDVFESLTTRERLVLQLAAQGLSSAEIARHLYISPRTGETHRANLMRKLGLHTQTDLVLLAIRKGIIQP